MKSWIFFLAVLVWSGVVWSQPVLAAQDTGTPVRIEVLERQDCAHCLAERTYLDDLVKTRSDISVKYYDIDTPEGKDLFIAVTSKAGFPRATPVTIVGTSVFQGFDTATTTGPRIRDLIEKNRHTLDQGFASFLANKSDANSIVAGEGSSCNAEGSEVCSPVREPLLIPIPLTSKTIDISTWALPALAATMGFFDGFNPCAMWVLVTFLIILMKMGSRRRMWLVAGSFILAEGIMYYVILMVWFRVWDFIGMDRIITPIVGTVSIGGGLFFLYEWYKSLGTELACRVVDMEERSRIVQQIKRLATG
jgi:glutaredoxin